MTLLILTSCSTIPSFHDTVSSDYKKIEKTDIKLSKAFAECEVLGEMARGKMVTDVLSEVDDYWKNRNPWYASKSLGYSPISSFKIF